MARGGLGQPALRHDALAARLGTIEDELPKAGKVARGGLDAAAADFVARLAEQPGGLLLHARRVPDLLVQIVGQRLLRRLVHEDAHQIGLAGAVVPARAGRRLARELAHVAHQRVHAGFGLVVVELGHVGMRVGIVFVPAHARGHGEQLAHAHVVVGRAFHVRDVVAHLVVHALDETIAQRRAHQRGGEGFGDREARPAPVLVKTQPVALDAQLAILQDHDGSAALAGHVGVQVDGELERLALRQRLGRAAGRDDVPLGQERNPVECAKGGVALRHAPEQQVAVGGRGFQQGARLLVQAEPAGGAGNDEGGEGSQGDFLELQCSTPKWVVANEMATGDIQHEALPARQRASPLTATASARFLCTI